MDHVPFITRCEVFEITFILADHYHRTVHKLMISNKSQTRMKEFTRWLNLVYMNLIAHIPRTIHPSINEERLIEEYTAMYQYYEDPLGGPT